MAKASECSAPAIPNMSAEYNGSSEMGACQPMAVGRKLLPPVTAGDAPAFVSERQYDAIIRLRERRRRIKEARERRGLKVKKHIPRDPKGRFVKTTGNQEGTNGGIMVPFSAPLRGFITANGYQDVTTVGSELQSSTPAMGFYWPSIATNEGGENIGKVMFRPFTATSGYDEATSGSKVPVSNTAGDFYWPIVATNDEEENMGEFAYSSILNLESPDPTTLLKIMMGNRYSTDPVSEQFQNVARLQAPDFSTLLTVMNNAGYDEAADDGHYDVNKVMAKLQGWEPAAGPS
ncbi:hypothetical protein SEVIR_3G407300v4 [Setaria viridis]|uniref:Nuclear transcription factor Y subunit n=1 Tax=Setaria viridis TaxID=4556 RepID=A0A4U6VLU4_SETVI|nr:uncharacterized protein LOC117847016 [Setaria viridis]XP_034584041.1 uncharacterized protein LOC117847016 [Setaria viridis]TKW29614.1 hypothetical protein SEVIR_3G407300v2 [Setaria viridis]